MKFGAQPILPSKMSKSQEKKTFSQNIFNKIALFSKKYRLKKKKNIFSDSIRSSRHFDLLFTCLGLIVKL